MPNFIVQFPLITEKYQEDILNKRFEIGLQIYNSLISVTWKRYLEMTKTKVYRSIKSELREIYSSESRQNLARKKELCKQLNDLYVKYNISEYSFHKDVKEMQHHFKKNIDSNTAQKIATNLWKAYDNLLYHDGKKLHIKRQLYSLEGKTNESGIRFSKNRLMWFGLDIPIKIDLKNQYEIQALQNDIAYCRIIRKLVRGKYKFYIQIIFKGTPPIKVDISTGEIKHPIGIGDVGLDIGTSTVAISSMTTVKIFELADKVRNIEKELRMLKRKMDRSRRSTNPDNYNENGTIKKIDGAPITWNSSNHYIKLDKQASELYRKQKAVRRYQHECLANYIISLGDEIYVETMHFEGLQKRTKETKKNDNGKFKSKKRFGRTIYNRAPAMLLTIINRKLGYHGIKLKKIDTLSVKASQYNHIDGTYSKKKLSQRWNNLDGIKVQRDMYSAFLIMNVNDDLNGINQQKCNERFEKFIYLHDIEIKRLSEKKNLSSIGI